MTSEQERESSQSFDRLFDPMRGDLILRFLTRGGRVSPLRLSFLYVVVNVLLALLLSSLEGNFWVDSTKKLTLLEDYCVVTGLLNGCVV